MKLENDAIVEGTRLDFTPFHFHDWKSRPLNYVAGGQQLSYSWHVELAFPAFSTWADMLSCSCSDRRYVILGMLHLNCVIIEACWFQDPLVVNLGCLVPYFHVNMKNIATKLVDKNRSKTYWHTNITCTRCTLVQSFETPQIGPTISTNFFRGRKAPLGGTAPRCETSNHHEIVMRRCVHH